MAYRDGSCSEGGGVVERREKRRHQRVTDYGSSRSEGGIMFCRYFIPFISALLHLFYSALSHSLPLYISLLLSRIFLPDSQLLTRCVSGFYVR